MFAMTKDGLALILFGGVRVAHGLADGFFFMLLGLAGFGIAIWSMSNASRGGSGKN